MTAHIRTAEPTATDAAVFAELANMASHDILADIAGPDVDQVLISMFRRDDNLYRFRQVWFLDVEGEVAGMLCAFTGSEKAELNPETDRQLLKQPGAISEAAVRAQNQLQPISEFIDTVPKEAFYVQFVAVYPQARGNGYAGQLLAFADTLARETASTTLELDVETGNAAALRSYLGQGMVIVRTSLEVRYDVRHRVLALHRMAKAIG